jgi:hypothetical protein
VAVPPLQPGGSPTAFGAVGLIGDALWVAGTFAPKGLLQPAAWSFVGDAFGEPVHDMLGQNFEFVTFIDGSDGAPHIVYNEFGVQAVLYDDPSSGDMTQVGTWWFDMTISGFGEVVRTDDGTLWGAGFATNAMNQPYWRMVRSATAGMSWSNVALVYSLAPERPATANALAIADGTFVVAGVADDAIGIRQWVTFVFDDVEDPGDPDDIVPNGTAHAAVIVDGGVVVAGDLSSKGAIRHRAGDGAFEMLVDLDDPVRDLAVGRDDIVLALAGTPGTGFTLHACGELEAGGACWRKLAEQQAPDSGELSAASLFVDGDTIWIAATLRETEASATAGALYRIDC